jgi:hypothetical protein
MKQIYRAWLPDDPEPLDFPLEAPWPEAAAADFVRADHRTDHDVIARDPLLVFVRDMPGALFRCLVTYEDGTCFGYPA